MQSKVSPIMLAAGLIPSAALAQATQPPSTPATSPAVAGSKVLAITLDEAVQRALKQNPTLEDALAAVRRSQAVVAEARSFQLPRVDGHGTFALQGPIPEFTFTQPAAPGSPAPKSQTIALGKTFTRDFNITGSYDPDPFGVLRGRKTVAQRQVNVARGGYYTAQNELVYSVQTVYLATLRAKELIGVQREALAAAQEQLRVAQAQLNAGTAPEFDVIRAQVQVENVRQSQTAAEANFRRTSASLARVLSLDSDTQPDVQPVALPPETEGVAGATARAILEPKAGTTPAPVPDTLESALREAFKLRPEVYRAQWARRAAESQVSVERKGHLPSVNLTAGGFYNPDAVGFAAITESWSVIANITVPIWDAGLTRARVRQAQAGVQSASAQLRAAQDTVADDVKTALIDLEDASSRRRAAAANTLQAREAVRIAQVRYAAGIAPNVEVTDAEAALTLARANEVNAAYDYLSALAELNRSLGYYASDTLTSLKK